MTKYALIASDILWLTQVSVDFQIIKEALLHSLNHYLRLIKVWKYNSPDALRANYYTAGLNDAYSSILNYSNKQK